MPKRAFLICAIATLTILSSLVVSSAGPFIYEYDWSGDQPGFSGALFLDAPFSNAGSVNDIGPNSYIQTPHSPGPIYFTAPRYWVSGYLTWTSQKVVLMNILIETTTSPPELLYQAYNTTSAGVPYMALMGVSGSASSDYGLGQWVFAVPEPSITPLCILFLQVLIWRQLAKKKWISGIAHQPSRKPCGPLS